MTCEIAWAAGLFEGEGSIIHAPYSKHAINAGRWQRRLALSMADRDVVERFARVVEAGRVRHVKRRRPNWSDQWIWVCSKWADIERILTEFEPWLGERRSEAAARLLANPPGPVGAPLGNDNARGGRR